MRHDFFGPPDHNWIFDEFEERSPDEQERFRQLFYKRMLRADSPVEVAQKALGVSSPLEVALAAMQTEEERRELLAHLQQLVPSAAGSPSAPASA